MDRPTYFYHTTSAGNEALIKQENILMPQVYKPPADWMLMVKEQRGLVPKGVWFCATLYDGDLPTISPYGDRRVRITIANVIQQLGGKVKLYAGEGLAGQSVRDNIYTRLMLVKEGDDFGILEHMVPLDIANNQWLILTGEYRVACRPKWVYIYIPYQIDVSNCVWDQL